MRTLKAAFTLCTLLALAGCRGIGLLEGLGGSCTQRQIVVTWPATITRGTASSSVLLTHTITSSNIDPAEFETLRKALTTNDATGPVNVTWTVPAFDVNGGYIALSHAAPLQSGETQQVGVAFSGGGWGAKSVGAALPPAISLRADNFTATSASGAINVLAASPLRLHIDVTTANGTGETVRVSGDAGFAYQAVTTTCT